jgi:tetratricopeptide (TPR) repeat protein
MDNEIIEKAQELEDNGDLKECVKYLDENIPAISDDASKCEALKIKTECYLYMEEPEPDLAKQSADEAMIIAQKFNDQRRIAELNLLISQVLNLKDDDKAVEYGRKAFDMYQKLNDKGDMIYSMISLATILKDYKEASSLFERAMNEAESSNDLDMLAQAAVNYSYLILEENGDGEPLKVLDRAIKKIVEAGSKLKRKDERINFVSNYSEIFDAASDIAMELDQYDLATKYASFLNKDPQELQK